MPQGLPSRVKISRNGRVDDLWIVDVLREIRRHLGEIAALVVARENEVVQREDVRAAAGRHRYGELRLELAQLEGQDLDVDVRPFLLEFGLPELEGVERLRIAEPDRNLAAGLLVGGAQLHRQQQACRRQNQTPQHRRPPVTCFLKATLLARMPKRKPRHEWSDSNIRIAVRGLSCEC